MHTLKIDTQITQTLQQSKNLLAFSAGGDSTALFFLLLEHNVAFDIAIVDYQIRSQSKAEVAYAQELAKRYNKQCFLHVAPPIEQNFEATAREIRYTFFEKLINTHHYHTLLTAHHLGDQLEWFLMQLTKGAGFAELMGMQPLQERKNYLLIRPLLQFDKSELLAYLKERQIHFFNDTTNEDQKLKRNFFRHNFAAPLLQHYKDGIKQSFSYLHEDLEECLKIDHFNTIGEFAYTKSSTPLNDLRTIDRYLKSKGYLLTKFEKNLLKHKKESVVGRKYLIVFYYEYIIIVPYQKRSLPMDKKFKESCRRLRVPPLLRPYLFQHPDAYRWILELHSK